jgi:hypothetical protein
MAKHYPPKIMKIKTKNEIIDGVIVKKWIEACGEFWALHRTHLNEKSWTISHYRTGLYAVAYCPTIKHAVSTFHDRINNLPAKSVDKALSGEPAINSYPE